MDEIAALDGGAPVQEKLPPLLKLKYNNAIADAVADLGAPAEIGKVFTDFQQYLYAEHIA